MFLNIRFINKMHVTCYIMRNLQDKSIFTENISDVHVKVGVGAIKSVSKHTDGRIQETEWTYSPCGNKVDFVAKDLKSGKCCKMSFEKFCDFSGSYKIISRSGLEEFCKVTGEEI